MCCWLCAAQAICLSCSLSSPALSHFSKIQLDALWSKVAFTRGHTMETIVGLLIQKQAMMCEAILVIVSSCHLRRPLGGGYGSGDTTGMLTCVRSCLQLGTAT